MTVLENINGIITRDAGLVEFERQIRGRRAEIEAKYGQRTCPDCLRESPCGLIHEALCPQIFQ